MGKHGRFNHSDLEVTCPVADCKLIMNVRDYRQHLMVHTKAELTQALLMRTPSRAKER